MSRKRICIVSDEGSLTEMMGAITSQNMKRAIKE